LEKTEYPFHPAFKYLSSIHKSDYMRCYVMHHYGGGYTDIKPSNGSWKDSFVYIKSQSHLLALGAKTNEYASTGNQHIDNQMNKNINNMITVAFFIYKPYSEMTTKWYYELHKKLDYDHEELKKHPARFDRESSDGVPVPSWEGGNIENTEYPIGWNHILGRINYPLQLQYLDRIKSHLPDWKYKEYK
jgi:hypothetical protein